MRAPASISLFPEDRLSLLRTLDEFRFWHSLDDRRYCNRCDKTITGRQVEIMPASRQAKARLQCPTDGCLSTPGDWTYADPVHVAEKMTDFALHAGPFAKSA